MSTPKAISPAYKVSSTILYIMLLSNFEDENRLWLMTSPVSEVDFAITCSRDWINSGEYHKYGDLSLRQAPSRPAIIAVRLREFSYRQTSEIRPGRATVVKQVWLRKVSALKWCPLWEGWLYTTFKPWLVAGTDLRWEAKQRFASLLSAHKRTKSYLNVPVRTNSVFKVNNKNLCWLKNVHLLAILTRVSVIHVRN